MSTAHATSSDPALTAPAVIDSKLEAFVIPVFITRPRYQFTDRGRAMLDQVVAAHSTPHSSTCDRWYASLVTAWRDTVTWASQAPEAFGPPLGVTAADMDPADDRLRRFPQRHEADALWAVRDHIPSTIADPYQRMLVGIMQAAEAERGRG